MDQKESIVAAASRGGGRRTGRDLKRTLGAFNLVALGIGAIIGAGIFVRTGTAAAQHAGPAVVLSFILAGLGCAVRRSLLRRVRVDDPDRRQRVHVRYATLGEFVAWIIGWDLDPRVSRSARRRSRSGGAVLRDFIKELGVLSGVDVGAAESVVRTPRAQPVCIARLATRRGERRLRSGPATPASSTSRRSSSCCS